MASPESKKPYTGFGKMLRQLMLDRDIRSWMQLSRMIEAQTGERYPHQSMSKYATGDSAIPVKFVGAFAETLALTSEERTDLAEQLAYHSRPPEEEEESA